MRTMSRNPNIVQKGNDIYLCIDNEWFTYNLTERPLGEGAMGTVYLGRSCQTGERVAIKRVVDKYANVPEIRERARLEANLLFRHKNLVEMIGYCELSPNHGPIFIVSKLVQGITLDQHVSQYLRNRKDSLQKICESVYPVFDALEYLHSKDIIHMDIKPSNIMIEGGCNVRLMDLGIAYTHELTGASSPGLIGTPKYAAPEQYREPGQYTNPIDKTTDIYELGVTLYELITGDNPYDSPTTEETLMKHHSEVLPYMQGVPNKVVDVLRKATDREQSNRYQTVREFKEALQEALRMPSPKPVNWLGLIGIGLVAGFIIIILIQLIL